MSRVQLSMNVGNLDAAIAFYGKLFGTQPAKRRPGYANFAISEPALKLVLVENPEAAGSVNHLGVEVMSQAEVKQANAQFRDRGLNPRSEEGVSCCYAVQDKVLVDDPDGTEWEIYTVLDDADSYSKQQANATCCSAV